MLTPNTDGGLFPSEICEVIDEFEEMIVWKKSGNAPDEEIPEPQPGLDEDFDRCNSAVDSIKTKLEEILAKARK